MLLHIAPCCDTAHHVDGPETPACCRAAAAAIATLLYKQNPIAWCGSAWWPGGRISASPLEHFPLITAETSSTSEPAARRETIAESSFMYVSPVIAHATCRTAPPAMRQTATARRTHVVVETLRLDRRDMVGPMD